MFDAAAATKHLSVRDCPLKYFLGPCGWRNSIFKSPLCLSTLVTTPTHQNIFADTADIWKTLDVFYIYFFGQWFVEIKFKKFFIFTCEFVSNFVARYWYKMVATPCSRHGLWLCKVILQVTLNINHFFLTHTGKPEG